MRSPTASTTKARMEDAREKLAKHLGDIADKQKQEMASRLATQADQINKQWVGHFINVLDRYDAILGKIQERADIAASGGKDVSGATTALIAAKTAVASARTAVEAQAAKTYTVDTSTLPTTATSTPTGQTKLIQSLRSAILAVHKALFKDLTTLRSGPMTDARKTVQKAIQALTAVKNVDEGTATSTESSDQ